MAKKAPTAAVDADMTRPEARRRGRRPNKSTTNREPAVKSHKFAILYGYNLISPRDFGYNLLRSLKVK